MFRLADVLRILESLREEARDVSENPSEEYRNSFGYGRSAGMLQIIRKAIEMFNEQAEEQAARDRRPEAPQFEGET